MSERDELAAIIMSPESFDSGPVSCGPNDIYAARIADAILAAGWRKPRTVTSVEELDALPGESIVRDASGIVYEKDYIVNNPTVNWWIETGQSEHFTAKSISLPATVLHEGEA